MAHASKEAVYLSNMMAELGFGKRFESASLFGDNTGALHIAGNTAYSSRTKHIALRLFYLKGLVKDGRITIHHVATQKQLAGVGTKFVPCKEHASAPTEPYREEMRPTEETSDPTLTRRKIFHNDDDNDYTSRKDKEKRK